MAVLNDEQLQELRSRCAVEVPVNYVKPVINAAAQAVEDWFSSAAVQQNLSNAIDTATSPVTLSAGQKRALVKWWLRQRADRGN